MSALSIGLIVFGVLVVVFCWLVVLGACRAGALDDEFFGRK